MIGDLLSRYLGFIRLPAFGDGSICNNKARNALRRDHGSFLVLLLFIRLLRAAGNLIHNNGACFCAIIVFEKANDLLSKDFSFMLIYF